MNRWNALVFVVVCSVSAACGEDKEDSNPNDDVLQPLCEPGRVVSCEDGLLLDLNLQATVAPGLINNQADGNGWLSIVDATAGGFNASPPHAYVYGKFTDAGLTKVSIDDESALSSMDWDVAFRRYVARINSGNSGPSCVGAVALPQGSDYAAVSVVPAGATYKHDDIFDGSCVVIDDNSGLPGSPATALSGYWNYTGCVSMTHTPFVLQLASGRHLKLTVDSYYYEAAQQTCDSTGSVGGSTGSGTLRVRWAFLD